MVLLSIPAFLVSTFESSRHHLPVTPKRRKWVLAMAVVAVATTLIALLTRSNEPTCQGKTLTKWVEIYGQEIDSAVQGSPVRHEGADAIRTIGTNALPFLVEWTSFDAPDSSVRYSAARFLFRSGLFARDGAVAKWCRFEREIDRAMSAARAFAPLGRQAEPAIPELLHQLNAPNGGQSTDWALFALANIGGAAIPALQAHLADTNAPRRAKVAHLFACFPVLATNESTVLVLIACANDADLQTRGKSAMALAQVAQQFTPNPELTVPALLSCLQDSSNRATRAAVANALGAYGDHAREAIPLLLRTAQDPNEVIHAQATNALLKIAPEVLTNAPPQ